MNISFHNIRGYGSLANKKHITQLIRREDFNVCFIQETKLKEVDENFVFALWGNKDMDWSFKGANGRSGGLLTMWKKSFLDVCFSFIGEGFLGINVDWKRGNNNLVNVYSSCSIHLKRKLWK